MRDSFSGETEEGVEDRRGVRGKLSSRPPQLV